MNTKPKTGNSGRKLWMSYASHRSQGYIYIIIYLISELIMVPKTQEWLIEL